MRGTQPISYRILPPLRAAELLFDHSVEAMAASCCLGIDLSEVGGSDSLGL